MPGSDVRMQRYAASRQAHAEFATQEQASSRPKWRPVRVSSRSSDSRCTELPQLPSHLWCSIVQHGSICDFGKLLCCSGTLFSEAEAYALWHYHAFATGYAQPVLKSSLEWMYPFIPEGVAELCIDWHKFLFVNTETRHLPSLWVRVADIDLRMPLPPASVQHKAAIVVANLSRLTNVMGMYRKSDSSSLDLSSATVAVQLRLRVLQWAGRPGPVLQGTVMAGDHLLLEWVRPGENRWPLPSHQVVTNMALSATLPSKPRSAATLFNGISLFKPRRRGSDSRASGSTLASVNAIFQRFVLVQLTAVVPARGPPLVQGEIWVQLDLASATLHDLYKSIADALRRESPLKDKLSKFLKMQLMDCKNPQKKATYPEGALLRKFFWTHCESLKLDCNQDGEGGDQISIWRERELTSSDPQTRGVPVPIDDGESPSSSSTTTNATPMIATALAEDQEDAALGEKGVGSSSAQTNGSWERLAPHYSPKLLLNTHQTRQFEFHPVLPQVMLTGDKKGGVNVIHTDEEEQQRRPLVVDSCPVLALAWMRHHPQTAVCGAAHSGQIRFLKYDVQANPTDPALQHILTVDEFPKLSSLSVNCTDDFLLASGFTHDLALYDTGTGRVLQRVLGVHSHVINISRFAHRSPHVFATASFDHTCKIWDIRQPLIHDRPAKVLHTGGLNVMCAFSPDDKYLLCSGIDTRITQFELASFRKFPDNFHLRPAMHQARYRRSMYFATSRHFVTAATDESHIRILSATGKKMGVVDFCGLFERTWMGLQRPFAASDIPYQHRMPARYRLTDSWEAKVQHAEFREEQRAIWENGKLAQGEVKLDDEIDHQTSIRVEGRAHKEYVQSVRTHPTVENRVGVLLSSYNSDPQSYIAFVHLDPNYSRDN